MAQILPTPRAGSWVALDLDPTLGDQPRAGTWVAVDLVGGALLNQPRAGTWLQVDLTNPRRRIRRGLGIVHTRSR